MVARAILYHPVLQYISHLIFSFKNINTPFEFREENMEKKQEGARREMHISWLLKDLECYNWYQMIARTMFCNHVIR